MSLVKIKFKDYDKEFFASFDDLTVDFAIEKIKALGANLFIVVGVGDMKKDLLMYWTGSNIREKEVIFEILRMVVKQYDMDKFKEVENLNVETSKP